MLFSLALLGVLVQGPSPIATTDTLPSASLFRPTPSHVILMSPVPAAAGGFSIDPTPSARSGGPDGTAPQLVEYSDACFTRLTIHRWASYLTVPLFASQYIVGRKLMNGERNLRGVHGVRATRNMDRLGIRLEGSEVVVDPTTVYHSDDDPGGWASAVVPAP